MNKLALLGGEPVISKNIPFYKSIGESEVKAVTEIIKSGTLSSFYGSWGEHFYGGSMIKKLEALWCEQFHIDYAVSVNSATSGLMAAMGAIGIEPGDEVILPPYTMSATAMAPLVYGGIPIFVDIEPDTFCLDIENVKKAITLKTKAIIAVNLFGHPAYLKELRLLADTHNLKLIEDNAQGLLAKEHGKYAGTIGHIGIFSLNYHKHIHCGEGGICVTNDPELAQRLQLIRNHGENVIEPLQINNISGLVGFNYRLTELCAAVAIEQIKNINLHVTRRTQLANKIIKGISSLEGIVTPVVRPDCEHAFYLLALKIDQQTLGISRDLFSKALTAEGFPHFNGYVKPLYHLPIFQKRIAFGEYPFNLSQVKYTSNLCPVTERIHKHELLGFETCMYDIDNETIDLLIEAIKKVHHYRSKIKSFEQVYLND
jgi:perosamine synthetase